jgi:hypothetical protein
MLASKTVRTGLIALAMTGLTAAVYVDLASADAEVVATGATKKARIKWSFCNAPTLQENKPLMAPPPVGADGLTKAMFGGDCDGDGVAETFIASAAYDFTNNVVHKYFFPAGSTTGGGLQTQGLPDTLSACVGFYSPGVPPVDSMVAIGIVRNPTNVTLSFQKGGLQVRMPTGRETSIGKLKVIVYPNLAAADADSVGRTGAGALPGGVAEVELAAGASNVHLTGNLSDRYSVRADGGGRYSARLVGAPAPLVVSVANQTAADQAAVVVIGHAFSYRAVGAPGTSTIGLAILALLLVASGVWLMRSRRTAAAA